jgi:hypothetical protein
MSDASAVALLAALATVPGTSGASVATNFEVQVGGVWVAGRLFDRGVDSQARYKVNLTVCGARYRPLNPVFGSGQSTIRQAVAEAVAVLRARVEESGL